MAELATLARPYANAAYEIAKESDRVEEWARTLDFLAQLLGTPEITELIKTPAASFQRKAFFLNELIEDQDPPEQLRRFINVLAENHRLDLLEDVSLQFEEKRAEDSQVLDVAITTAVETNDKERATLEQALRAHFQSEITVSYEVQPELIGGAFIRTGDRVIDGSVKGKLAKMQEALGRA